MSSTDAQPRYRELGLTDHEYELIVDGNLIPLLEARQLLERDDAMRSQRPPAPAILH